MKKLILAASLAALLPLLFSCGKPQGSSETTFEEPRFIQYAGQLIPRSDLTSSQRGLTAEAVSKVTFIELTESGVYVIGITTDGDTVYTAGTFTVSGDTYSLNGFGTIKFSGTSGEVDLTITPNGGSATQVKATLKRASASNQAYRGWTVDKTRLLVGSVGVDLAGLDFSKVAEFLKDNGFDISDAFPMTKVSSVSLTGAGSFIVVYSDGSADIANCNLSGSSFSYSWADEDMGFSIDSGKGTIEYMDGKCIVTLSASVNGTAGTVALVLSPMA